MSAKVGKVYFTKEKQSRFLSLPGYYDVVIYSDATAEIIDHEVSEIIKQHYETAQNILEAKKSLLKKSAELLLEKETIEGQTLEQLVVEDQPAEAR
jgi:cell division protease FtsH